MRMWIVMASLAVVSGVCVLYAQDRSDRPTEVGRIGYYLCPSHTEIAATWPARCPMCRQVLQESPRSDSRYDSPGGYSYFAYTFPYTYPSNPYDQPSPYYDPMYGYYNPHTGYYFNPRVGYYFDPRTSQGYFARDHAPTEVYPRNGDAYPHGDVYPDEEALEGTDRSRGEREEQEERDRE